MTLRLPKETHVPIRQGQIISLTACYDYWVEIYNPQEMKLKWVRNLKPEEEKASIVPEYHFNIPEKGATLGRAPKCTAVIPNHMKSCSGKHLTIFGNSVVDSSTHGTYVYLKDYEEQTHF